MPEHHNASAKTLVSDDNIFSKETIVGSGWKDVDEGEGQVEKDDPWIGRVLSDVKIERLLSRGGMGAVYLGWHEKQKKSVAVKILHERMRMNPFFMKRFRKEADAIVNLDHPNIIRCVDCAVASGRPYFVMELVEGVSLDTIMEAYHRQGILLPMHIILQLSKSLAEAIDHSHERGVLHLDIKPGNIMLESDVLPVDPNKPIPPDLRGVLTDFGLARMGDQLKWDKEEQFFMGTPAYVSPEMILGEELDTRSDVYALGLVIYEMLAGEPPFPYQERASSEVLQDHLKTPPPWIIGVSRGLQAALFRAMAKEPDRRYSSAGDLVRALETEFQHPSIVQ